GSRADRDLTNIILVIVGVVQAGVLVWQACVFARTLKAINHQASIMQQQTIVLRQSVEAFVNKERPILRVEPLRLEWPVEPGDIAVNYAITLYGSTEAFVEGSCARLEVGDSGKPPADEEWRRWPPMRSIPDVFVPSNEKKELRAVGISNLIRSEIDAISEGKKSVYFWGFVEYTDVFDRTRKRCTRFKREWKFDIPNIPDLYGTRPGDWYRCGAPEDNSET